MAEKPNKSGARGLPHGVAIGHESDESPAFDADSIGIRADSRSAIPPDQDRRGRNPRVRIKQRYESITHVKESGRRVR